MYFLKNACLINEYKDIIEKNIHILNELEDICKKTGEKIQGNCFTKHLDINKKIPKLLYKQCNHFSLGKISNRIMEIGFNAGHSCLLYLLANPTSKIVVFDICEHKYTKLCFEYLQTKFPNRLEIYPGDSTKTVPDYHNNNPNEKFDLIHIDGCHHTKIANLDFQNSLKLASDIIIWDDTQVDSLNKLFKNYIKQGLIYEVSLYKTFVYKHRICRLNPLNKLKYKWNSSHIEFIGNGNMNAFGKGRYNFIDKYCVKCDFGNKEHIINFNEDYSKFTSIRKDDFEIVNGEKL